MSCSRTSGRAGLAVLLAPLLILLLAGAADALTIDFEGLEHGRIVSDQFQGQGVTISATNVGGGPDLAVIFDSFERSTADPDLEGPNGIDGSWDTGNLAPETQLGNMLILQENDLGAEDGIVDTPDDEGDRPAGQLTITFDGPITSFGLDLIDIEGPSLEDGDLMFFSNDVLVGDVDLAALLAHDGSIVYGDNSANRVAPFTAAGFNVAGFDRVVIDLGGSGAIDNLVFERGAVVPEPGTLFLMLTALAGVEIVRRRLVHRS